MQELVDVMELRTPFMGENWIYTGFDLLYGGYGKLVLNLKILHFKFNTVMINGLIQEMIDQVLIQLNLCLYGEFNEKTITTINVCNCNRSISGCDY